jgi:GDPmannose 4,6-dehydratase
MKKEDIKWITMRLNKTINISIIKNVLKGNFKIAKKMLQMKKPDDYIIATGKKYSVRTFIKKVAKQLNLKIKFIGKGLNEKILDNNGNVIVKIDKNYFRPLEVPSLLGDSSKAKKKLHWKSRYNIDGLINDMIKSTLINEKI